MPVFDVEPVHPRLADRLRVLQRADPSEIVDEAVHHQVDLHPAQAWNIIVLIGDTSFELRRIADKSIAVDTAKFLFHLADEPGVFLK